eukprot:PhF_6_TR43396/c1_g1_i1/m.66624/K02261/COX2; cytochrome c oxidase subunit 2
MFLESDIEVGDIRLLQVNNFVFLYSLVCYKLVVSSVDVIHSLTCGALGIKCDCIPGRSNDRLVCFALEGHFLGKRSWWGQVFLAFYFILGRGVCLWFRVLNLVFKIEGSFW